MKKISLALLFVLVSVMLFGCGKEVVTPDVNGGTAWSNTSVDKDLVGAWQIEGGDSDVYYIFTENCKIQMVRGTATLEGNVLYGIDANGNHKYKSDCYFRAGELDYVVAGDVVTFTDAKGVQEVLKKVEYTAPVVDGYENFKADNPLVGTWYNEEYKDTFVFAADGTAVQETVDTEQACVARSVYKYTEADGKLIYCGSDGEGVSEYISDYTIKDNVLNIDGLGDYVKK